VVSSFASSSELDNKAELKYNSQRFTEGDDAVGAIAQIAIIFQTRPNSDG